MERKCGDEITPSQSDYLKAMRLNGRRLSALIDDLLELHRAQRGELRINKSEVDIEQLIHNAVEAIRPLLEQRHQLLDLRINVHGVTANVDGGRVTQVLLNILSNASKYSPEGSTVHIGADVGGGYVYFTIRDEGEGFEPEARSKIFEPYFRAAEKYGNAVTGTGLGLAVSRSLVELHNGVIDIVSKQGEGTIVAISLPDAVTPEVPGTESEAIFAG